MKISKALTVVGLIASCSLYSFSALGSLPITQCWAYVYASENGATNVPGPFQFDGAGNAYGTSSSSSLESSFWSYQRNDIFGRRTGLANFDVPANSSIQALAVDSRGSVYIAGSQPVSSNLNNLVIYHLDGRGDVLGMKTLGSQIAPGPKLLAIGTDSANNLDIAIAAPLGNGQSFLELYKETPDFTVLKSFSDMNIQPSEGFFGPEDYGFFTGHRAASDPATGYVVDGFNMSTGPTWTQSAYDSATDNSETFVTAHVYPGALPGECAIGWQYQEYAGGGEIDTFSIADVGVSANQLSQTAVLPGSLKEVSVGSHNDIYAEYYLVSNGYPGYHVIRTTSKGTLGFDLLLSKCILVNDGTRGVFVAFNSPPYGGETVLQKLDQAGHVSSSIIPTGVSGGKSIPVSVMSHLYLYAGGVAAVGQIPLNVGIDDAYLARYLEPVTLQRVSLPVERSYLPGQGAIYLDGPAPTGGVVVSLSGTRLIVPTTVTVPPGARSAVFPISCPGEDLNSTGKVTAHTVDGTIRQAIDDIWAARLIGATPASMTIAGGSRWSVILDFTPATGPDGLYVRMRSDHPLIIPSSDVLVRSHRTSDTASGTSNKPEANTLVKLTFSDPNGGQKVVSVTVTAN